MEKESLVFGEDCILAIRNAIFNYSLSHESFTIRTIAELAGYSTTTVAKFVNSMKDKGAFVVMPGEDSNKKGRKAISYAIKFNPNYFLGVDVLHSGITFGLMNMNGTMARTDAFSNTAVKLDDSFADVISGEVTKYIDSLPDINFENIFGISVNIRGAVARNTAERITEKLGIPSSIENNTNAMAYCEYTSLNLETSNLLFVHFGWGLGLGIIINRQLFHGSHRTAGEIGHMPIYNNNILCHCGKKGCLETEVSISAIIRKVTDKISSGQTSILSKAVLAGEEITIDNLIEGLRQEDPLCMDAASFAAQELGKHLAGIAGLLDPDSIIIAGPMSLLPDYCFMDHVKLAFNRHRPKFLKHEISISSSTMGEDSAVIGACLIARDTSSIDRQPEQASRTEKVMNVPFVENLEKMDEVQIESVLVRNTSGAVIDVVNWPQLYPYAPQCLVRLVRSRNCFAISFTVSGMDLRATEMEDNGRSWEDSCCEFYLSPGGDKYYNIEINCIGAIRIGVGVERNNRTLLDVAEIAKVKRWSSLEKKRYEIEGGNFHWSVTALIPFSVIGLNPNKLPDEIRGNFYKCGDRTAHPHFVSWNPISSEKPDFHCPEFFGRLLLK